MSKPILHNKKILKNLCYIIYVFNKLCIRLLFASPLKYNSFLTMATEEFIDFSKAEAQMSLGMRLDAAIQLVDSFSSTHLYVLIVGLTVIVSFLVLGTANIYSEVPEMHFSATKPKPNKTGPEPRWHIFGWFNFVTVALFVWSVADFAANAQAYLNYSDSSILLKFLLGWSVLLCYFFSFFGISFVHDMTDGQQSNEVDGK